jgi:LmbE family N-acetylglucosaminyl deacetylase
VAVDWDKGALPGWRVYRRGTGGAPATPLECCLMRGPETSSKPSLARLAPASLLVSAILLGAGLAPPLAATGVDILPSALEPAATGGAAAVDHALAKLSQNRRLLMIGAHPDDENTSTLALVAREQGGEAAYLSMSRGDGGQNLIGPELGAELGVIRTHELLVARRVDGARQYFGQAFDFGYTRSLAETLRLWPEPVLLEDAVRVIRRFRPQVLFSVFGDDASGGHGQHQAAGHTAYRAYTAAGDPKALPQLAAEGLVPWRPQALYRASWFAPGSATATAPLGGIDPWTGLSIAQLARLSRSQHRSQDMGRVLELGGAEAEATWVAGAGEGGHDLFAGIDTSLGSIADTVADTGLRTRVAATLDRAGKSAAAARAALVPDDLAPAARALESISRDLATAAADLAGCGDPGCVAASGLVAEKRAVAAEGLAAALDLDLDATVDRETLVPGETAKLTVELWNAGSTPVEVTALAVAATFGAVPAPAGLPRAVAPGELVSFSLDLEVPADARPTFPDYLARPRQGDLYDWSQMPGAERGEPFGPAAVRLRLAFRAAGATAELGRDAVYRYGDQALGEVRRPLRVVPRLEVAVSPDLVVVPLDRTEMPEVSVTLRSNAAAPLAGDASLELDCAGAPLDLGRFALAAAPAETTLAARLPRCASAGRDTARVVAALDDGEEFAAAYPLIEHPHIPPTPVPHPAAVTVVRADLELPHTGRIAYVPGAADRVPGFLEALGLPVEELDGKALAATDLARFDVVVLGSRAYEVDPNLADVNSALLDWVRAGGTMIVQYQQYQFIDGHFAPLPLTIARPHDRITDENAPVTILAPGDPVFTTPNRIGPDDWQGWVQERSLYMAHTWDPGYRPLLEMTDPDQPPQRGGLLVAHLGRGTYVYTGLAFFRQIPAGVPGAYRLFANLLALGRTPR